MSRKKVKPLYFPDYQVNVRVWWQRTTQVIFHKNSSCNSLFCTNPLFGIKLILEDRQPLMKVATMDILAGRQPGEKSSLRPGGLSGIGENWYHRQKAQKSSVFWKLICRKRSPQAKKVDTGFSNHTWGSIMVVVVVNDLADFQAPAREISCWGTGNF
jgi:hypothetical protein